MIFPNALHNKKYGKPIRRVSKSRAAEVRRHPALREAYLLANPVCFKCGVYVDPWERQLHHWYGRIHGLLNYVPGFRTTHRHCHDYIEKHRKEAILNGWRADENLFNSPSKVIPRI